MVIGNVNVQSNLNVTDDVNIQSNLNVIGNVNIQSNLMVIGNVNVQSNLNVTDDVNIQSNLMVIGNVNVQSNLNVTNLNVTGNVNIKSNLMVTGITIIGGSVGITGNLDVSGNTSLGNLTVRSTSTLSVIGNILYSNVYLNKSSNISSNTVLNYPLYNSYNITNTTATSLSITLPTIQSGQTVPGSTINFFKSGNLNTNVYILSSGNTDKFVANGGIITNSNFAIESGTTSATLISSFGSSNNYWTGIGGGGGGNSSGNVNIGGSLFVTGNIVAGGNTNTPGYTLTVIGKVVATSYNATSDRRLKSNINMLPNQTNSILQVTPVTFDWKLDGKHDVGFIAQNVYDTYPELLPNNLSDPSMNKDEPTDVCGNPIYYAIDYGKMTPFLWQGMREIIQRLDSLESENRNLKTRIEILESR